MFLSAYKFKSGVLTIVMPILCLWGQWAPGESVLLVYMLLTIGLVRYFIIYEGSSWKLFLYALCSFVIYYPVYRVIMHYDFGATAFSYYNYCIYAVLWRFVQLALIIEALVGVKYIIGYFFERKRNPHEVIE